MNLARQFLGVFHFIIIVFLFHSVFWETISQINYDFQDVEDIERYINTLNGMYLTNVKHLPSFQAFIEKKSEREQVCETSSKGHT